MNVRMKNRKLVHEAKEAWETALSCTAGSTRCDKPFSTHPLMGDSITSSPVTCKECGRDAGQ